MDIDIAFIRFDEVDTDSVWVSIRDTVAVEANPLGSAIHLNSGTVFYVRETPEQVIQRFADLLNEGIGEDVVSD